MTASLGESGKRSFSRSRTPARIDPDKLVRVGCGRCEGCRLEYARQWAARITHEAQLHPANAFLTLTYDDKNIPFGSTLLKPHLQEFIAKYRRWLAPWQIRFYGIGEYGGRTGRPHYHAIIFGHDFGDKKLHSRTESGCDIYASTALAKLWPYGFSSIGAVTPESANYVARYSLKKQSGQRNRRQLLTTDRETGELTIRTPEFALMSLRPAIGKSWLTRYKSDVYPGDFIVIGGRKQKPPRYYDQQLPEAEKASIKESRRLFAVQNPDNSQARLDARREVKLAQIKQLKRGLQ